MATMNHIPKFEDFTALNEASTTKGIPTELFNAIKGAQIGTRVVGKNFSRKPDKTAPEVPFEVFEKMPSLQEVITPYLKSKGWMNNPNIKVVFRPNDNFYKGWMQIFIGKYMKLAFRLSYGGPREFPFSIELRNEVKYNVIKRVELYGHFEDQVQAVKNVIDANMDVWNIAMNEAPQSTADAFLDDPDIKRSVERIIKGSNDLEDCARGIVGLSLSQAKPGAERKKELQDVIKFIQKYLNDKDFINADMEHRFSGYGNILNTDGEWE